MRGKNSRKIGHTMGTRNKRKEETRSSFQSAIRENTCLGKSFSKETFASEEGGGVEVLNINYYFTGSNETKRPCTRDYTERESTGEEDSFRDSWVKLP